MIVIRRRELKTKFVFLTYTNIERMWTLKADEIEESVIDEGEDGNRRKLIYELLKKYSKLKLINLLSKSTNNYGKMATFISLKIFKKKFRNNMR